MLAFFLYEARIGSDLLELQACEPADLCVGKSGSGPLQEQHTVLTAELSLQALQVSEAGEPLPLEDDLTFLIMKTCQPTHTHSVHPQKRAGVTVEFLVMVVMAVFMLYALKLPAI